MNTIPQTLYDYTNEDYLSSSVDLPLTSTINEPTMPFYEFPPNINTLCIKSTMGIGKTNTLYDFLKYNLNVKYRSCLIVSFRRSLCYKYATDLPSFQLYEDINKYQIDTISNPYVIIQVDSLKRIRDSYDLIIFDEYTYTMNQLICSARDKKKCFDVMDQLCNEDNHMIFMDAMLEKYWVDYITSFNRRTHYIINTYSIHNDKKIINYINDEIGIINRIKKSLDDGENIVIASNSKNKLRIISNILHNDNKYCKLPSLYIMKDSKEKYNINEWKNVRILMYSPSIVAGVSFVEKHFNRFFGLFCNTSAVAEMSVQQMFRVRNISSNEYNLCFTTTGKNDYPKDDKTIKELILKEDKCLVTGLSNININYIKNDIIEDSYFKLFLIIQKIRFMSCNNYEQRMLYLLKNQGIINVINVNNDVTKEDKKAYNKIKKEVKKYYEIQEAIRIVNSTDRTTDEIDTIKDKVIKTEEEIYELKKNSLLNTFKINSKLLTSDLVITYGKFGKQLWNLAYINAYSKNFNKAINKRLNYEEKKCDLEDISYRLGRDRKYEKIAICEDFINYVGFNNSLDKRYIEIDKNKFKDYLRDNHEKFELLYKCKKINEDIFTNDKWYFKCKMYLNSRLYNTFKIRIVEDRKLKKFYIKGLDFWNEIITYKNDIIIDEIKNNEINLYYNEEINDNLMDILNNIQEYNNKKCINCNNETINDNKKCLTCKFKLN